MGKYFRFLVSEYNLKILYTKIFTNISTNYLYLRMKIYSRNYKKNTQLEICIIAFNMKISHEEMCPPLPFHPQKKSHDPPL